VFERLKEEQQLPSDICARLSIELADLLEFRRDEPVKGESVRHLGYGWSEKVIKEQMLRSLKLAVEEMMTRLRIICETMEDEG
jgi:hypothetical protein